LPVKFKIIKSYSHAAKISFKSGSFLTLSNS
jgi:hypothetical protein